MKIQQQLQLPGLAKGRVNLAYPDTAGIWTPNTLVSQAGQIIGNLVTGQQDGYPYRINGMFFEFENNGGAAVTVPDDDEIDRDETVSSYYLALTSNRDFLRVPIIAGTVDGNTTRFYAQTQGTEGINGEPFDHTNQSRIYGAALVCMRDIEDPTLDLIYARVYFQASAQLIKLVGSQIGGTWEHIYS